MTATRYQCAQKGCPNSYTEVVGQGGWGSAKGADCLPCYYAGLLNHLSKKPEDVEGNFLFMVEMKTHLETGGWTWQDVKDSHARGAMPR